MMRHDRSTRSRRADDGQGRPQQMTGLCTLLRRFGRDQRGAIAAIFAVLVPVLVAIVGFGVETGIWYTVKRHNQSVADVAALSGALEIAGGGSCATGWASCVSAKTDAKTNGFDVTDPTNTASTLTVTTPGGIQTVTATLKHQQTPLIVGYLTGTAPFTIFDQAVAQVQKIDACVSGIGTTGTSLLVKGGAPTISLPGCTITSDSTSANSIDTSGSAATIDAYSIITAGGVDGSCKNVPGLTLPPTCSSAPPADPYASVNPPTMPAMPSSVTTFPALAAILSAPATQNVNASVTAPTSATGAPCVPPGTTTFTSGCHNYVNPLGITISNATFTGGQVYSFTGPITIGAGVTIGDNVT